MIAPPNSFLRSGHHRYDEHVVLDIRPEQYPDLPSDVSERIGDEARTFAESLRLSDLLRPAKVRDAAERVIDRLSVPVDLAALDLDSYPHRRLQAVDVALLSLEHAVADERSVADRFEYDPAWRRHGRAPRLGDLVLEALDRDTDCGAVAAELRAHIADTRAGITVPQTTVLRRIVADMRAGARFADALAGLRRIELGISARDGVTRALALELRDRRDSLLPAAGRELRAAATSAAARTATVARRASYVALTLSPSVVAILCFRAAFAEHGVLRTATAAHDGCIAVAVEPCPLVAVGLRDVRPVSACADAAERSCAHLAVRPSYEEVYGVGGFGALMLQPFAAMFAFLRWQDAMYEHRYAPQPATVHAPAEAPPSRIVSALRAHAATSGLHRLADPHARPITDSVAERFRRLPPLVGWLIGRSVRSTRPDAKAA